MDIQKILDHCDSWSEGEKANLKGWFDKIAKFKETQLLEILKDSKKIHQLFYLQKNIGVARNKYTQIARGIRVLLGFYGLDTTIPSREQVLSSQSLVYFFKDLGALINRIDFIGDKKLSNYDPTKDLLYIKALAILGWYGFRLSDIANIEKSTLIELDGNYFVGANKVQIDCDSFKILSSLANEKIYRQFPLGKMWSYQDSNLLFKNAVGEEKISVDALKLRLVRFNEEAKKEGFSILFRQLQKNALFVKVSSDCEFTKPAEVFKKTHAPRAASDLEKEYLYWKKITDKEEI